MPNFDPEINRKANELKEMLIKEDENFKKERDEFIYIIIPNYYKETYSETYIGIEGAVRKILQLYENINLRDTEIIQTAGKIPEIIQTAIEQFGFTNLLKKEFKSRELKLSNEEITCIEQNEIEINKEIIEAKANNEELENLLKNLYENYIKKCIKIKPDDWKKIGENIIKKFNFIGLFESKLKNYWNDISGQRWEAIEDYNPYEHDYEIIPKQKIQAEIVKTWREESEEMKKLLDRFEEKYGFEPNIPENPQDDREEEEKAKKLEIIKNLIGKMFNIPNEAKKQTKIKIIKRLLNLTENDENEIENKFRENYEFDPNL